MLLGGGFFGKTVGRYVPEDENAAFKRVEEDWQLRLDALGKIYFEKRKVLEDELVEIQARVNKKR